MEKQDQVFEILADRLHNSSSFRLDIQLYYRLDYRLLNCMYDRSYERLYMRLSQVE